MKFYFRRSVFFLAVSAVAAGFAFAEKPQPSRAAGAQQARYRRDLNPQWEHVPGRVIVKFKPEEKLQARGSRLQALLSAYQVIAVKPLFQGVKNKFIAEKESVGLSRIFVLEVPAGADIGAMVKALNRHPAVEYAEPDYLIPADVVAPPQANPNLPAATFQNGRSSARAFSATPNDPRYGELQHLPQIKAPSAWEVAKGDSNVVVAIIDTGTDWDHPDLAANIWRNADEIIDGVDNDNNGFVDDVRGWDFVDAASNPATGEDGNTPDNNPMDFNGHGTHTAGIAAAATNNNVGVAAISWNVKVMPLRIGWHTAANQGLGRSSFMAAAFIYAADNGAHAANLSFGNSNVVVDGARYAFESGVVVTVSAGNGNSESASPLAFAPFAISVAAVDDLDRKASYSTYGDWVLVSAPGGDLSSNRPGIISTVFNDSYASFQGTSMSSPLTAGLAALLKSQNPQWSNLQIMFQIVETADDIESQNADFLGKLGSGRINALRALTETVTPLPRISYVHAVYDDRASGNGNRIIDAGESGSIVVALKNVWADARNVTANLSTDDEAVSVTKASASFGTLAGLSDLDNNIGANSADPFAISVASETLPHRARFTLEVTADNGYHGAFVFHLGVMPDVFLVDDDDSGSLLGGNDVQNFYAEVMDSLAIAFDEHNHVRLGSPTFETMKNYPTVIWLCEWTFPALDSIDRAELKKFLDNGGSLFLSGQDVGFDLADTTDTSNEFVASQGASRVFYNDYLHARYLGDDSPFSALTGVAGDPISDGLQFDVFQPGRTATQQFPDEITPIAPAVSIFNYGNGRSGAVRFAGSHRVVNFAFGGYEAIVQKEQRDIVMPRVVNWLNGVSFRHTPLRDTEDFTNARAVSAQITSTLSPLTRVELYWKTDDALQFNKLAMADLGSGNYGAEIPAQPNKTVEYFIFARTQKGFSAPIPKYSYVTQPDRTPPVLANLTQLVNTMNIAGPYPVTVEITDNLGVDLNAVMIHYRSTSGKRDSVKLSLSSAPNRFEGNIPGPFAYGDTVFYQANAKDQAASANRGVSDEKSFVAGIDDFENGLSNWSVEANGWGLTQLRSVSGSFSVNESPAGAYGQNLSTSLTLSIPLDFSGLSAASLFFMESHLFQSGQDDFGVVEASGDGGQTWTQLSEEFRGIQSDWRERSYALKAFTGAGFSNVRVRFRTQTDSRSQLPREGWFVDDVRIVANLNVAVAQRDEAALIPATFALEPSYPNPLLRRAEFGLAESHTTIRFALPLSARVEITVYDLLGRRVAALLDEKRPAGVHLVRWDARDEAGNQVATGIYFYRLQATPADGRRAFQSVRKMVVQ